MYLAYVFSYRRQHDKQIKKPDIVLETKENNNEMLCNTSECWTITDAEMLKQQKSDSTAGC